jgi:hypothetical protein
VEVRDMLLLISPEKWQDLLRLAPPVRVPKAQEAEDDGRVDVSDAARASRLVGRRQPGSPRQRDDIMPPVGGLWLTHLTPFNKDFNTDAGDSPEKSNNSNSQSNRTPNRSPNRTPRISPRHSSVSEFDLRDISRTSSVQNTPRSVDLDLGGGGSSKTKPGAAAAITASRRTNLRPEKPAAAMDADMRRMVQAMLSSSSTGTSLSLGYDVLNQRLESAGAGAGDGTNKGPSRGVGGAIDEEEEEDDEDEEEEEEEDGNRSRKDWLYKPDVLSESSQKNISPAVSKLILRK